MATAKRSTRITSSARNSIDRLPIKKRTYLKARTEGATIAQAAATVGVSTRMGGNYEKDEDVQAAYRMLMRDAIPAKVLVNLVKGGTQAKIPVYGPDGKKKGERADWKTRKPYIEMASKHGGYFEEKVQAGAGAIINLTVNHIGQPSLGDSVHGSRSQHIIEAATKAD